MLMAYRNLYAKFAVSRFYNSCDLCVRTNGVNKKIIELILIPSCQNSV